MTKGKISTHKATMEKVFYVSWDPCPLTVSPSSLSLWPPPKNNTTTTIIVIIIIFIIIIFIITSIIIIVVVVVIIIITRSTTMNATFTVTVTSVGIVVVVVIVIVVGIVIVINIIIIVGIFLLMILMTLNNVFPLFLNCFLGVLVVPHLLGQFYWCITSRFGVALCLANLPTFTISTPIITLSCGHHNCRLFVLLMEHKTSSSPVSTLLLLFMLSNLAMSLSFIPLCPLARSPLLLSPSVSLTSLHHHRLKVSTSSTFKPPSSSSRHPSLLTYPLSLSLLFPLW